MNRNTRIGPDTIVQRSQEPVAAEVERSVVMMSLAQGKYYGLEGAGGRIWRAIERPRSVTDVCADLQTEFDVEMDVCLRDVSEFLTALVREGLVDIVDEAADPVRRSPVE